MSLDARVYIGAAIGAFELFLILFAIVGACMKEPKMSVWAIFILIITISIAKASGIFEGVYTP